MNHTNTILKKPEDVERKPGIKLDHGKPQVWYGVVDYFADALAEVALHSQEGDAEPGHVHGGWKTVDDGYRRYSDAMMRHILDERRHRHRPLNHWEELKIARAIAWNALARLQMMATRDLTYAQPEVESGAEDRGVISSRDRDRG